MALKNTNQISILKFKTKHFSNKIINKNKERRKCFIQQRTKHILFTVIWCQIKDNSDSDRGNLLLPHGLLFLISSKGSFKYTIPQTGQHIPLPLLHQSWSTGWIEK